MAKYTRLCLRRNCKDSKMRKGLERTLTIAVAAFLASAGGLRAEEITGRVQMRGSERSYVMVVPKGAERRRLPVVVALHGALMDGRGMQRTFALDGVGAREDFITVYPDGINRRWNDGRRQPWRRPGPDDVAFLVRLARHLVDRGHADPRRLYLAGVSNGGMMAFRVACEAPGTFTAYAAIAANMPVGLAERCRPGKGVPMLIMNSTRDPLIPWKGGPLGFAGRHGRLISTEESVAFWKRNNGCRGERQRRPLPDKDPRDGSTVMAEQFKGCRSGAPVVLIAIEGGGHLPPGSEVGGGRPVVEAILGKANRDISAADIAWKFFRRFPEGR
jgi:polyhydroxybutyrate depolymerase